MSEADFAYEYSELIKTIKESSPLTEIILNSIYPVSRECKALTNNDICNGNKIIRSTANEFQLKYIDTNKVLCDKDGFAPSELIDRNDGIHWTREGCELLIKTICREIT